MKPEFVILKNKNLEVVLSTLGASIFQILFHNENMVLTPVNDEDYQKINLYYGKTIGRVAGRIELNGLIQDNDNGLSLHGGFDGISTKYFDYHLKDNVVEFQCISPDGEAGYPGNFVLYVRYELLEDSLLVNYTATVDKPCLVFLTNHAYFCLGEASTNKLSLQFKSTRKIVHDDRVFSLYEDNVPEQYDFSSPKILGQCGNIDDYFILDDPKVKLISTKFEMTIESNFLGLQMFTDHFFDGIKVLTSQSDLYRAVALEPEDNPLKREELLPGQKYERSIKYTFKKL